MHIRQQFVGANPKPRVEPLGALDTRISFLLGDSERWQTDLPTWSGVRYVDLYPQIDLEVTSRNGQFVQRLVAHAGADLSLVKLQIADADAMRLDGGTLQLQTLVGEFRLPLLELAGAVGGSPRSWVEHPTPSRRASSATVAMIIILASR